MVRAAVLAAMGYADLGDAPVAILAGLTVINAMLRGCFEPAAAALVADLAPPGLRVAAYSLQRVGINVGWAAGAGHRRARRGRRYAHLFYAARLDPAGGPGAVADQGAAKETIRASGLHLSELLAFTRDRLLLRASGRDLGLFHTSSTTFPNHLYLCGISAPPGPAPRWERCTP